VLSNVELSQIRADIALLLPDTCDVLEVTYTSDSAGGNTETWGTVSGGSTLPCRVDYRTGRETFTGGAIVPYQQAVISLAYDETITAANRIQIGTNIFSVQAVNTGQSWKGVARVTAELVP
jgi:head-tail adaptor